jgi:hypothetical protein
MQNEQTYAHIAIFDYGLGNPVDGARQKPLLHGLKRKGIVCPHECGAFREANATFSNVHGKYNTDSRRWTPISAGKIRQLLTCLANSPGTCPNGEPAIADSCSPPQGCSRTPSDPDRRLSAGKGKHRWTCCADVAPAVVDWFTTEAPTEKLNKLVSAASPLRRLDADCFPLRRKLSAYTDPEDQTVAAGDLKREELLGKNNGCS